jgi:tripartite-type tricarboxylate transporter receptor subunit TctC
MHTRSTSRFHTIFPLLLAAGSLASPPAPAQTGPGYPVKPIRIVSGFPPGGVNDIVARTIATKLAENTSTAVIVDNRPGAATMLANAMVAKADPNGYTLLMYSSSFAIGAAIQGSLPYDPVKDFAGVAPIGLSTQALIVPASLGIKSVKELIALAKAQPGKVILGSSGAGTGSHLVGERFRLAAGINVVHVGFKGNADMLIQIAGGRVHYGLSNIAPALPLVKDGKLAIIAVMTRERSPALPEVPTVGESLPGFSHQGAFGLLAPARTPRPILALLNKEVGRITGQGDGRERLLAIGIVPISGDSPEQFEKFVHEEVVNFTKVAREIGLRKP